MDDDDNLQDHVGADDAPALETKARLFKSSKTTKHLQCSRIYTPAPHPQERLKMMDVFFSALFLSLANFAREAECCWLRCFLFVRRGAIRSVEAREREKILVMGCVSDEKYCPKKKKEIITGTSQA